MSDLNTVTDGKIWSPEPGKTGSKNTASPAKVEPWEHFLIATLYVAYICYMAYSLGVHQRYASLADGYEENGAFLPEALWDEHLVGLSYTLTNILLGVSIVVAIGIFIISIWRSDALENRFVYFVTWLTYSAMAILSIITVVTVSSAGSPEKIAAEWAESRYDYTFLEAREAEQGTIMVLGPRGVEHMVSLHTTDEGILLYEDEEHLQEQLDALKNR